MFVETKDAIAAVAVNKAKFLNDSRARYFVASSWAGSYVGLGIALIMVIGGMAAAADSGFGKLMMGLSFGIALSLVIMAGSELFTGNNFVMMVGSLDKKVSWVDTWKIWLWSYGGNLLGSILIGAMFVLTGLGTSATSDFILKVSEAKMNGPFVDLFFKGVLCNLPVCLAVLSSIRMKSEAGKLIMIFWCLFAFITSGFEHSIANMTIFSTALFLPHGSGVTLAGALANLIPVTLGNFVGGGLLLGVSYYFMGSSKKA